MSGHNAQVAAKQDEISATDAIREWKKRWDKNIPDFTTIYFPGPDTMAQGDVGETQVGQLVQTIHTHSDGVTDPESGRFLDYLEHRGYQYACAFALTADHGQIAFRTDDLHRLMVKDSNGPEMLNLWEPAQATPSRPLEQLRLLHSTKKVADSEVVYAPNGGMGQFYIRDSDKNWAQPPANSNIEQVAQTLYWEAIGQPEGGKQYVPDLENALGRYGPGNDPINKHPAIFVRQDGFNQPYKWFIHSQGAFVTTSIDNFINQSGMGAKWPEFARRIEELNERIPPSGSGSRSGDILIMTDGREGFLTEGNDHEILPGWHGGPTVEETEVPLLFNFGYRRFRTNSFLSIRYPPVRVSLELFV